MVEAMEIQEGFKETDVGFIPIDWELKSIGGVCQIFGRIGFRGYTVNDIVEEGSGAITISPSNIKANKIDFNKCTYISWFKYEESPEIKIFNGDILLVKTGSTFGKTAIVKGLPIKATINPQLVVLKKVKIDNYFLAYLMGFKTIQNQIKTTIVGGAIPTLSQEVVSNFKIPLPPTKAEQTAIATALNDADALISSLEKIIAKKCNIKQGAMQELLKPKEGWKVRKLGKVAEINMGQSPDSKNYNLNGEGMPLIQGNADIKNRKSIRRVWTKQITKTCKQGDLIMTVRAPVGAIGIASENSCIGRGVCSFKVTGVDKSFLFHLLIFKETDWRILEQGSTFTSANSIQIFGFELSIPKDEPEQTRIAQIISDMDAEIDALENKLEKYKMIKQGMMQNLLTGRIRLI